MTSTTYTGNRFKILKQWDSNSLNDHVQLGAFLALQKFSVTCKFLKTCSSLHISNEPSVGDNCTSLTVKFTWDYYLRMLSHIVIIMWEKTKIMSLLPVPCRLKGLRSWAKPELKISLLRVSSVLLSSVFSFPHHFFSPSVFFINPFRSVLATFFLKNFPSLLFSLFTSELVLLPFLPSYQSKRLIRCHNQAEQRQVCTNLPFLTKMN